MKINELMSDIYKSYEEKFGYKYHANFSIDTKVIKDLSGSQSEDDILKYWSLFLDLIDKWYEGKKDIPTFAKDYNRIRQLIDKDLPRYESLKELKARAREAIAKDKSILKGIHDRQTTARRQKR